MPEISEAQNTELTAIMNQETQHFRMIVMKKLYVMWTGHTYGCKKTLILGTTILCFGKLY